MCLSRADRRVQVLFLLILFFVLTCFIVPSIIFRQRNIISYTCQCNNNNKNNKNTFYYIDLQSAAQQFAFTHTYKTRKPDTYWFFFCIIYTTSQLENNLAPRNVRPERLSCLSVSLSVICLPVKISMY